MTISLDIFFENFVNLGILTNVPVANFFLMHFDNKEITADKVYDKFIKSKIILRKMRGYGLSNSLRVTIGNNKENNLNVFRVILLSNKINSHF
jgi:histidinol-phosphate/aromatic aminotransferase/cobyric acid decarboxylase-like protein